MPRPVRFTATTIAERALPTFWARGDSGTSIDDVLSCTGASRQVLYRAFPDKRSLLLACVDVYRRTVVDPAFAAVERPGAGLRDIANYFETQIAAAEAAGLPGPGCLLVNLATEVAPHDAAVAAVVQAHVKRLRTGFANVLRAACADRRVDVDPLASLLATTAQGLWASARVASDASELRRPVRALMGLIEGAIR